MPRMTPSSAWSAAAMQVDRPIGLLHAVPTSLLRKCCRCAAGEEEPAGSGTGRGG